jgi:hypothetical protein
MRVSDFMASYAAEIIERIEKDVFTSWDFIWQLMLEHELEYIQLLNDQNTEHPIWDVHKLIGRYLSEHSEELGIDSTGEKKRDLSPFGKGSATEIWRKI